MSIETMSSPDGKSFTHRVTAYAGGPPADQFTDSVLDLERLSEGDRYPMTNAWETTDGWAIEVSLWSQNESPTAGPALFPKRAGTITPSLMGHELADVT